MFSTKMMRQVVAAGGYSPNAVKFDGANDYLLRGGDLTGIADSKSGIFSCWVRWDGTSGQQLIRNTAGHFIVMTNNVPGPLWVQCFNSSGTRILNIYATGKTGGVANAANWYHFLASWDLAAGASSIYINDTADQTVVTRTNDTIDYAEASGQNWGVGRAVGGGGAFDGALSELYFAPGQYLDLSVEANRRKFIDASGLPVSLGADGSTPTGVAPIVYLKGDYTAFGVNSGSGGDFTLTGALQEASTTPATAAIEAVKFDGSADYLTRGGDLTGIADGKAGTLSFWMRRDGGAGTAQRLLANVAATLSFYVTLDASNKVVVTGKNAAASTILTLTSNTAYLDSPIWRHVIAAWNLASGAGYIYVNNASDLAAGATLTDDTIDYATGSPNWGIGADTDGTDKLNASVAELYFTTEYLDLSVEANRRKFITADGKPADLGTDGSTPTGTAPLIYLPNRAALVGTNAGSGGNFTINGAPKDANSTPLYYYAEPATFDGTNDYLTRGADLTGIADGKAGTVSFWIRRDGGAATAQRVLANLAATLGFYVTIDASNNFVVTGKNAAASTILTLTSNTAYALSAVWVHVLVSWNLATTAGYLYVNNASDLKAGATLTDDTIDYATASANWGIGGDTDGTDKLFATLADLWFTTTYIDISDAANRAKFIDQTTLRPVPLGATGELPTGTAPLVYLGRDYTNFHTNLGSGGAFTVTGALTRGTTSPSDVTA